MTELEKMQRAQMYIAMLAEGIDPLSGEELPGDTMLNNVRLSRCFFYVADVLRKVIENGGEVGSRARGGKEAFAITPEQLQNVRIAHEALPITQICANISEAAGKKLGRAVVSDWLTGKGFLRVDIVHGRKRKRVTESGEKIGIVEETRNGAYGEYLAVLYSTEAQRFIVDNLPQILSDQKVVADGERE